MNFHLNTILKDFNIFWSYDTHFKILEPIQLWKVKRFVFFYFSIYIHSAYNKDSIFRNKWNHLMIRLPYIALFLAIHVLEVNGRMRPTRSQLADLFSLKIRG